MNGQYDGTTADHAYGAAQDAKKRLDVLERYLAFIVTVLRGNEIRVPSLDEFKRM